MLNVVHHASSPVPPNTEGLVASAVHVVETVEIGIGVAIVVVAPASTRPDASPLTDVAAQPSRLVLAIVAQNHGLENVVVMSDFARILLLDDGG